jgi:hypothetical protein
MQMEGDSRSDHTIRIPEADTRRRAG